MNVYSGERLTAPVRKLSAKEREKREVEEEEEETGDVGSSFTRGVSSPLHHIGWEGI